MAGIYLRGKTSNQLSRRTLLFWRAAQFIVWLTGVFILNCLLFYPSLGILLFWNILIPAAPALLVLAPGVWRNVCPLASMVLMPRHLNISQRKKISEKQSGLLNLSAVTLLFVIVPLRHAIFNNNGVATAILIIVLAITGIIAGFFYEWKSAWCSGLCPIHPVEKLYGENVWLSVPNAHCDKCTKCTIPCPDSTKNLSPISSSKNKLHKISAWLITGGLPGFIWGWFHIRDEKYTLSLTTVANIYKLPLAGLFVTLIIYALLRLIIKPKHYKTVTAIFAASGVACYYWYRIPSLFGVGLFKQDGLLIDLKNILPFWIFPIITLVTTIFFFYRLVARKHNKKSWLIRPEYASKKLAAI